MQREEEVVVAEVALLLVLVVVAEMAMLLVLTVMSLLEAMLVHLLQYDRVWALSVLVRSVCVCLVKLVLQWECECALDSVGRCTIR